MIPPWKRRDSRGIWPADESSFEPPADPAIPIREATFVPVVELAPVSELLAWKVAAGMVVGVNAALGVVQAITIWALWRAL
jgi:hypothetical protein